MKLSMPEGTDKIGGFNGEFTRSGERCPGRGGQASDTGQEWVTAGDREHAGAAQGPGDAEFWHRQREN